MIDYLCPPTLKGGENLRKIKNKANLWFVEKSFHHHQKRLPFCVQLRNILNMIVTDLVLATVLGTEPI